MKDGKKVTLDDLSPEAIAALKLQLKKETKSKETKVKELRKGYKDEVNKKIPALFRMLTACSAQLSAAKSKVYKELDSLVTMKSEVYERDQDQGTHSFTTDDGTTITIGYRMNDGWDDTAEVGIQKVTDFIKSLGKDKDSKTLVETVLQLLSRDNKGNLKASRVLQLKKLADNTGHKKFIDAIQIIQDAYRPSRSKQFVTCRYKNETGETKELPLNISEAEII
jgi:hypothetical protein